MNLYVSYTLETLNFEFSLNTLVYNNNARSKIEQSTHSTLPPPFILYPVSVIGRKHQIYPLPTPLTDERYFTLTGLEIK